MKNFVSRDLASLLDVFKKLKYILTGRQKQLSIVVFLMTVIGAALETLGVSIIVPLVQSFLSADKLLQNEKIKPIVEILHITTGVQLIIWISVAVILLYIVKNVYMILLSYVRIKFAVKVKRELSVKIMNAYMEREYSYFLGVNTADVLRGIGYDVSGVHEVLFQIFRILAEFLTVVCICVYIFYTDIMMAIGVVILMGCMLGILMIAFRKRMKSVGECYRECTVRVNKYLYESFQGIKDVFIFHRESFFIKNYEKAFSDQQRADVSRTLAAESPAYIIEAVCISGLIVVVGFKIVLGGDASSFVPQLAAFAVAAFRILPSIGKISAGFNQLVASCPALNATYNNLVEVENYKKTNKIKRMEKAEEKGTLQFENKIELRDICWKYPQSDRYVIENLNLKLKKGRSVAFIGQSGAGKSTLADILLGLLVPEKGDILVDGKSIYSDMDTWKKTVGYVPQSVFLTDDTIRKNIAFGIEEREIDDDKIRKTIEQAQLTEAIAQLPEGVDTILGERGIRFSGGQKQRVAIARALYNDPEILILDEATAALDNDTENAVMEAIDALHGYKTLIIIAHRLSTIRNCDEIYEIGDGVAKRRNKEDVL